MMLSSTQPASPHAPNATESPMGSSSRVVPTTAPEVATTQSSAPIFSPRSAAAATLSAFAQVPMTNSNQNAVVSSQPRVLSTGSAPAVVSADAVAFKGEHKRQLSNTAPTAGAASSLKGASTGGDPQVPSSHYHPHRSSHHPIMVPLYLGSLPAFANPSQNQANQQMIYTHAAVSWKSAQTTLVVPIFGFSYDSSLRVSHSFSVSVSSRSGRSGKGLPQWQPSPSTPSRNACHDVPCK